MTDSIDHAVTDEDIQEKAEVGATLRELNIRGDETNAEETSDYKLMDVNADIIEVEKKFQSGFLSTSRLPPSPPGRQAARKMVSVQAASQAPAQNPTHITTGPGHGSVGTRDPTEKSQSSKSLKTVRANSQRRVTGPIIGELEDEDECAIEDDEDGA